MRRRLFPWALLLLASASRFVLPAARPLHHDEGTNYIFLRRLIDEGIWLYDPSNYHGPILYHLGAIPILLRGSGEAALRFMPALIGALMPILAWSLRDRIGRAGAAAAGLLIALSPCFVFYSRFQIHEIYLAGFTLGLVAALARALGPDPVAGGDGWRIAAWAAAGMAAGAMLAAKETAIVSLAGIALAAPFWGRGRGARLRPAGPILALIASLGVAALLYTNFFRNPGALADIPDAFRVWGGRGLSGDGHDKPWWYFVAILAREEPWAIAAGVAGCALAIARRDAWNLGLVLWAATALAAYSLVPYKTPWLVLNPLLPILLIAGGVVEAAWRTTGAGARRAVVAGLAIVLPWGAGRALDLAILRPDVEGTSALVYVQTDREVRRMIERIEDYAAGLPERRGAPIDILSPDYLPLNWYLRDYPAVSYWGRMIERPEAPILIVREDQAEQLAAGAARGYERSNWRLRPGVNLILLLRPGPAAGAPPTAGPPLAAAPGDG